MQDYDFTRPPPPPLGYPPQPPRRPLALFFLLAMLVVVAALPYVVERVQYASTRGRARARADTASEELNKLKDTAGLVSLADTSHVFNLVAKKVEPCVVHIDVEQLPGSRPDEIVLRIPGRGQQITQGQGSGFIADDQGYILTNRHVVENATAIRVSLADGRTIEDVALVGDDELTDLAVLKIRRDRSLDGDLGQQRRAGCRRLGAGGRQSVWPRPNGNVRHRQRDATPQNRPNQQLSRFLADRRGRESRQ